MTQIPQELLDRLRKCCEWLGKEMPEKFVFDIYTLYQKDKNGICTELIKLNPIIANPILSDPLCEYPNSLHRIVWEACEKRIDIEHPEDDDLSYSAQTYKIGALCYAEESLTYHYPLHAEIEACCMAIEERMK